jgi:hypothetical protein|tara:strand:- start:1335 stop:1772 length:438 start_codon:yes stop_codon:yes gene_type:complete
MKFTVREVGLNAVTVDFADGSWADVAYTEDLKSKEDLIRLIHTYAPQVHTLPADFIAPGEELDSYVPDVTEEEAQATPKLLTYSDMRSQLYPSRGDQLDALYWARQGDPSQQEEIDKAIAEVKALIPKNIEPMTTEAFSHFLLSS